MRQIAAQLLVSDAGGGGDGAQALLLGAQAMGLARIGDARWAESDNQDYENREGVAYGRKIGMLKPVFDSVFDLDSSGNPTAQDFAVLQIKGAAAA